MNWIEILRLIVAIWPLIEKILALLDGDKRDAAEQKVEWAAAHLLGGETKVASADEVIAILTEPLKLA